MEFDDDTGWTLWDDISITAQDIVDGVPTLFIDFFDKLFPNASFRGKFKAAMEAKVKSDKKWDDIDLAGAKYTLEYQQTHGMNALTTIMCVMEENLNKGGNIWGDKAVLDTEDGFQVFLAAMAAWAEEISKMPDAETLIIETFFDMLKKNPKLIAGGKGRSHCTIGARGNYLTDRFRGDVARGKDVREIGSHVLVNDDVATVKG